MLRFRPFISRRIHGCQFMPSNVGAPYLRDAISKYNGALTSYTPEFYCANREREVTEFMVRSASNWGMPVGDKVWTVVTPQAPGAGKTKLAGDLPFFLCKTPDMDALPFKLYDLPISHLSPAPRIALLDAINSDLIHPSNDVTAVCRSANDGTHTAATTVMDKIKDKLARHSTAKHCDSYLDKLDRLKTTRPIVINCARLSADAKDFNQALLVEAAAQVLGLPASPDLAKDLANAGVTMFGQFCSLLLETNGAAVIVLDDFFDLIDDPLRCKLFGDTSSGSAKEVFRALYPIIDTELRKPGMVMPVTGRSIPSTYRLLQNVHVTPIMLDALSVNDIINITTSRNLQALLGLRSDRDVQVLATCLHTYTGGQARVVMHAINAMIDDTTLQLRGKDASIENVLSEKFMDTIYEKVSKHDHDALASFSTIPAIWDKTKTIMAVLEVVQAASLPSVEIRANALLDLDAAEKIRVINLLAMIGIPFEIMPTGALKVHASPWILMSLLKSIPKNLRIPIAMVYCLRLFRPITSAVVMSEVWKSLWKHKR